VDGGVSGTLAAPKLVGRVHLVDGALLLGVGLPALEALTVELELDPNEVRIVRFTGESGAAPFELQGRARLDGRDDALDLRFAGQDLLVWRGQGVKVRADVDVALGGGLHSPLAKGRITLRNTRITRNLNALQLSRAPGEGPVRLLPPAFEEGPLSILRLDLELDARDPVQLENNIVLGACVPDLHLGGTGREPVVTGLIVVKPSRVALPGSVVQLTGGTLTFAAGEPGRPTVDLAGEARVRSWDVTLGVKGPFDEQQLDLSSRPPLPAEDVLLLLLTGQPPAGVRAPGQGDSGPVAVYLGQDLLARWLTETPDPDAGLVERFDVTYAEDVTTRGSTSLQVSYRLEGEGGAGRTLYLQAEKDPYDAVNFGLRWRVRLP
jgi:translocation and assembly module TamB